MQRSASSAESDSPQFWIAIETNVTFVSPAPITPKIKLDLQYFAILNIRRILYIDLVIIQIGVYFHSTNNSRWRQILWHEIVGSGHCNWTVFPCQDGVNLIGFQVEWMIDRFATPTVDAVTSIFDLAKTFRSGVTKQDLPFRVGDGRKIVVR